MRIEQRRIREVSHCLWELPPGSIFYVSAPLAQEESERLIRKYGLKADFRARIPIPRGTYTVRNVNGQWQILRHLPKEPRVFEHCYHIVDRGGNDHYGVCYQTRMCYQRKLIPPMELYFTIEDGVLYSEKLVNSTANYERIKLAINVVLEMLGHCEIWTAEKIPPALPETVRVLPWEILRTGTRDKCELNEYIEKMLERKPEQQSAAVRDRHEWLQAQCPDFYAVGSQNFFGYVVYGFSELGLYVFECNQPCNATYLFTGDWQAASQLTKTEILSGHIQDARVFHTDRWHENIQKAISRHHDKAS